MDNPEKLVTDGTQDEHKEKENTIYVGHHYAQANTNNVNKTLALQTTGGKDEPNIFFMRKLQRIPQHETQNAKKHNTCTYRICTKLFFFFSVVFTNTEYNLTQHVCSEVIRLTDLA